MILVDTSVWAQHIRSKVGAFAAALEAGDVLIHPFVIGELACGQIKNRLEILSFMRHLPEVLPVSFLEFLHFVEKRNISGSGIGFVDAHVLASSEVDKMTLWTLDKPLLYIARKLDLSYL